MYQHERLLDLYCLDTDQMSESLQTALSHFRSLRGKATSQEALSLLQVADRNLTLLIVRFLQGRTDSLEEIVIQHCQQYRKFFEKLLTLAPACEGKGNFIAKFDWQGYTFEVLLQRPAFTPVIGGTVFFDLLYSVYRQGQLKGNFSYSLMLNFFEKTCQPFYYQNFLDGSRIEVRDFTSNTPNGSDAGAQMQLNQAIEGRLYDLMTHSKGFEAIDDVKLEELIKQIRIALN